MADLIAVGYWQSSDESPFPHPALLQGAGYSRETREGIASYLKSGARFATYMGWSYCRFRCGVADSALGDSDLSDGFCVWPQGLAHYITDHDVRLPEDFIETMGRANWVAPTNIVLPPDETLPDGRVRIPISYFHWIAWARNYVPHLYPEAG